jgi:hypothetical protein
MMLPDWIPAEAWEGYLAMRKKKRAVMTERAVQLRIADLKALMDEGHDIAAVLDQSTANGWTDVYPVKEKQVQRVASPKFKTLGKHGQATANNLMDWLEEA